MGRASATLHPLAGARTGVDVLDAYLKDVIVPAEIRAAAMQLVHRQDARCGSAGVRAGGDRGARGRSPTQASSLDAHPALAQLRLVQQIPCGSRVVLAWARRSDIRLTRHESPYQASRRFTTTIAAPNTTATTAAKYTSEPSSPHGIA